MISDTQLGYTVNLYPTNNRILINGKDVDRFMDKHLPLLHEMMIKAMREFGFRGVEAMNNILCEQNAHCGKPEKRCSLFSYTSRE